MEDTPVAHPEAFNLLESDEGPIPSFSVGSHPFDLQCHPHLTRPVFAVALVSGAVDLYGYDLVNKSCERLASLKHLAPLSARQARFFEDGRTLGTCSADGRVVLVDESGAVVWATMGHSSGCNALLPMTPSVFATGDDDGIIKVWDMRKSDKKPTIKFAEYEEFVSDLGASDCGRYLLATSGDTLGVYDLRKAPRAELWAMCDPYENDFNCVCAADGKAIVGSQAGEAASFVWGDFGWPRHVLAGTGVVQSMTVLEEDVVLFGSEDGIVRVVNLDPFRVAGVLGGMVPEEGACCIEALDISADANLIVTASEDQTIRFFSTDDARKMAANTRTAARQKTAEPTQTTGFFDDI